MINALYRAVGSILSPGGDGRLSILIYHQVLPEPDTLFPGQVTAEIFDSHLVALKSTFNILPLGEAIAKLKSGLLPPRAACITFDDGYADNVTVALPALQRHRLPATFFIATAYLDGGRMFNDTVIHAIRHSTSDQIDLTKLGLGRYDVSSPDTKRQAINAILLNVKYLPLGKREDVAEELATIATNIPPPRDLMMTAQQLRELSRAGMEIGGHTARHPILATLDAAAARREIAEGKDYLEGLLGAKVKLFAYPNGKPGVDYLPEQVELPRSLGFDAAVSTGWGSAGRCSDIFQLPRFTPYAKNIRRFIPMLMQNLMRGRF